MKKLSKSSGSKKQIKKPNKKIKIKLKLKKSSGSKRKISKRKSKLNVSKKRQKNIDIYEQKEKIKKLIKTGKLRKSPTISATKYNIGTKMWGNDDKIYVIIETKTGVHKWIEYKSENDIINMKKYKKYGSINLNDKIVISDPTYNINAGSKVLNNVNKGEYNVYLKYGTGLTKKKQSFTLQEELFVINKNYINNINKLKFKFISVLPVDSGQMSIFNYDRYGDVTQFTVKDYNKITNNYFSKFKKHTTKVTDLSLDPYELKEINFENWYGSISGMTLNKNNLFIPNSKAGVNVNGFGGDGHYNLFVAKKNKKYVAFRIVFNIFNVLEQPKKLNNIN